MHTFISLPTDTIVHLQFIQSYQMPLLLVLVLQQLDLLKLVLRQVPLISIRLSPSVDNNLTGALGAREIINRMQLQLKSLGITVSHDCNVDVILNGVSSNQTFENVTTPSLSELYDINLVIRSLAALRSSLYVHLVVTKTQQVRDSLLLLTSTSLRSLTWVTLSLVVTGHSLTDLTFSRSLWCLWIRRRSMQQRHSQFLLESPGLNLRHDAYPKLSPQKFPLTKGSFFVIINTSTGYET